MYYGKHNQEEAKTNRYSSTDLVAYEAEEMGWEDIEWDLYVTATDELAEFPCEYYFHHGSNFVECELTTNKPGTYCPTHSGEGE